jgi:hypothetical protein
MHPIRPLNRPNPAAIARRQALTGMILELIASALVGAALFLIFYPY